MEIIKVDEKKIKEFIITYIIGMIFLFCIALIYTIKMIEIFLTIVSILILITAPYIIINIRKLRKCQIIIYPNKIKISTLKKVYYTEKEKMYLGRRGTSYHHIFEEKEIFYKDITRVYIKSNSKEKPGIATNGDLIIMVNKKAYWIDHCIFSKEKLKYAYKKIKENLELQG